ncbi:Uma2 family endonuclease [uncultured Sphingomonas sp.]|uniref:Uma2 family endonuclease n=1 Tax=uncultured Sphingomonas sp. TaxID=158754 RepID=UPI0035CC8929
MTIQEQLAPGKYKLTVDDYLRLAEAGAFGGRRTELIDGEVIVMSPQFRPHGMVKLELYDELLIASRALGSPLRPVVEFSLDLATNAMPDPDIMLTNEPRGAKAVPLASVALVIEVSDTTLNDDLSAKQRLYATAGIPEYWVADVNARVIHQMWSTNGDKYARQANIEFGTKIASATITGLSIETSNL